MANSTVKINSHGMDLGLFRFRIGVVAQTPMGPDQALSNPATYIVSAQETKQIVHSLTDSDSDSSSSTTANSSPAGTEENRLTESGPLAC